MPDSVKPDTQSGEVNTSLRQQAQNAYDNYLITGSHLTGKEVVDFLRSCRKGKLPKCHN